ncbi:hypothetical protein D779_3450 [Imhoffiella purpurea]|uniref:Uncharacterized protein n=1 Tax=Imhoffiella purpurea TaxID=1249627 RepID=W9VTH5_9GAMM|nr:hypothetical protein D779_3450 [Imhoffiella purpurea]
MPVERRRGDNLGFHLQALDFCLVAFSERPSADGRKTARTGVVRCRNSRAIDPARPGRMPRGFRIAIRHCIPTCPCDNTGLPSGHVRACFDDSRRFIQPRTQSSKVTTQDDSRSA